MADLSPDKRREDVLDVRNQMAARAIQWERQPGIHNGVTIAEELRWWIDRFDEAMPASTPSHVAQKPERDRSKCLDGTPCAATTTGCPEGSCIRKTWQTGDVRVVNSFPEAFRPETMRPSVPSTTPQKPGVWEWPINTVGRLIGNLQNMPPEMPFYTAYFVEIAGQRVTRTTHPSVSRETVAEGRVQKYDAGNESVVMWATCMPSATREISLSGCAPRLFGSGGSMGTLGPFGLTVRVDPEMPEDELEFRDGITGRVLAKIINVGRE